LRDKIESSQIPVVERKSWLTPILTTKNINFDINEFHLMRRVSPYVPPHHLRWYIQA